MNTYLINNLLTNPEAGRAGRLVPAPPHRQRQGLPHRRACRTGSTCAGRRSACRPRARRRSSPSTWPRRACSRSSATWRSPAASTIEVPHGRRLPLPGGRDPLARRPLPGVRRRVGGTVLTSGAGVVVLRRLADALDDGDPILAVIKGSAVNNDGARKVGFLAPSVDGHADVVKEALAVAGCRPATSSSSRPTARAPPSATRSRSPRSPRRSARRPPDRGFCRIDVDQAEHRPPRHRGRRRRPDQGRAGAAAPRRSRRSPTTPRRTR